MSKWGTTSQFSSQAHKSSDRLQQSINIFVSITLSLFFHFPKVHVDRTVPPQAEPFKVVTAASIWSLSFSPQQYTLISAWEDQSPRTKSVYFGNRYVSSYQLIPIGRREQWDVSVRRENLEGKKQLICKWVAFWITIDIYINTDTSFFFSLSALPKAAVGVSAGQQAGIRRCSAAEEWSLDFPLTKATSSAVWEAGTGDHPGDPADRRPPAVVGPH